MDYITNITGFILKGSIITLQLYAVTILFSIPIGVICALGKISRFKWLNKFLEIYTWVFRGTPLLLQLFFTYYGLPVFGIKFGRFQAAAITFIFNYGAYFTEIFRGGIESIDKGQYEAAKALGMNYRQTMSRIILPQAVKRVLPPTSNEAITLIKDTALVAAIGMGDILRAAKEVLTRDFQITSFIIAGIIYLLLTSVVVMVFKKLEQRYSIYE
ncbi:amino acid ABC transporter permease [Crassaminicella profunda]|uniref:amino acid ABC transporter permease n=1 Tax=Crassaminicella profunda TaxID=1286698 RepID=UPI001CA6BCDD|nr:amino acid ABC transporter permease [Crassaminicella profunda]QZY56206.1 amino acid ABC transporter permease [Crassaminicella profunda]